MKVLMAGEDLVAEQVGISNGSGRRDSGCRQRVNMESLECGYES